MSKELGPGNSEGKHEALRAMFARADEHFSELFLAGEGFEEKDIDAAFVFYYSQSTAELLELHEQSEPVFTDYRIKRQLICYDAELINGLYHVRYKQEDYEWYPTQGLESFASARAIYNETPRWLITMAQSLTDEKMPAQSDEPEDLFKDVAAVDRALHSDLKLIHQTELYKPEVA